MTEEEAKTKWCCGGPMMMLAATAADMPMLSGEGKCVGSACMAWRQEHPRESREDHSGASGMMAKRAVETNRIVRREGGPGCLGHLVLDATGFCGLAGKP